ncbi:uncharacterized protein N7529_010079 [Penicillium soppii]|uniref:uncharacterized protein n=1 Tax=Penicillium soppii TaxID=69789 RepID=UPI0025467860|nr:uncharacterized protein N7529_010079 [Penicillium soppii]KAJ5856135.1 hypothetical protein N7529_010079 [Penicillium soppii]
MSLISPQPATINTDGLENVPVKFGMVFGFKNLLHGILNLLLGVVHFLVETLNLDMGIGFLLRELSKRCLQRRLLSLCDSKVSLELPQLLGNRLDTLRKLCFQCHKSSIFMLQVLEFPVGDFSLVLSRLCGSFLGLHILLQ